MDGMSRYQVSGWLDNGLLKQIDYAAETGRIKSKQSIQLIASGVVALVASAFFADVPSTSTAMQVSPIDRSPLNGDATLAANRLNHEISRSIRSFDSPTISNDEFALLNKAKAALIAAKDRKLTLA